MGDDAVQCEHREMGVHFSQGLGGTAVWSVRCIACDWVEAHGEGNEIPEGVTGAGVVAYGGFASPDNDAE